MENKRDIKRDFTSDIALAIKKLELFSEGPVLEIQNSLQRTIELAKSFISIKLSGKSKEKTRSSELVPETEVLSAIRTIQKNYLFIQKLKKGTPLERALADSASKVIQRYNETIQKKSKKYFKLSERISHFIYRQYGSSDESEFEKELIHFPKEASVQFNYPPQENPSEKISQTAISNIYGNEWISKEEGDAFRMKAISLLKNQEMRFLSMNEDIRSTPIQVVHSNDLKRIMMSQTLKPFPGVVIAFKGEFQRDQKAVHTSIPLSETFNIKIDLDQTGFPHPSQYTGFSFDSCMIPTCPLKMEQLKKFSSIFKLKQKIASALLPKGDLISKAREILKLKKQVFEENKVELLGLHCTLRQSICEAFEKIRQPENGLQIIEQFFERLKQVPFAYAELTKTEETITEHFILRPFDKLKEDFIEQKNEGLQAEDSSIRYETALKILEAEQKIAAEKFKDSEYVSCMGQLLGSGSNRIILQHMSEVIDFIPESLGINESKIQIALYKQLDFFHEELNSDKLNTENILNQFRSAIKTDIEIFAATNIAEIKESKSKEIVNELKGYYELIPLS